MKMEGVKNTNIEQTIDTRMSLEKVTFRPLQTSVSHEERLNQAEAKASQTWRCTSR